MRSFPSAAVFGPDGDVVLAPMPGSAAVAAIALRARTQPSPELGGVGDPRALHAAAPAGATTVAFTRGGLFSVYGSLERAVAEAQVEDLAAALDGPSEHTNTTWTSLPLALPPSTLPDAIQRGRRLFSTATDPVMSAPGAGAACANCHLDGRNDGLTWALGVTVDRQTPSLAGDVTATAPFTWTSEVATVQAEAELTATNRMGGAGPSADDLDDIAAFIAWTRPVDLPDHGRTDEAVGRGAELFHRADLGCAACHPAPTFTDGEPYDLYGLFGVEPPSLPGVAATAPYLHDGRAASLAEVVAHARTGEMGGPVELTDEEIADLVAYLRSL